MLRRKPKLGRGPIEVVQCLHCAPSIRPARKDAKREIGYSWNLSTPDRFVLPGEPTSGRGRKGYGSERDVLGKPR
jgi:hypothetical protein